MDDDPSLHVDCQQRSGPCPSVSVGDGLALGDFKHLLEFTVHDNVHDNVHGPCE